MEGKVYVIIRKNPRSRFYHFVLGLGGTKQAMEKEISHLEEFGEEVCAYKFGSNNEEAEIIRSFFPKKKLEDSYLKQFSLKKYKNVNKTRINK